jgi:hypothetical protein
MQHTPRRQDATFGPARRFMPLDAPPPPPGPKNALQRLLGAFLNILAHSQNRRPDRATGKRNKQQRKKKEQKK